MKKKENIKGEVYIIKNNINDKVYIGQTIQGYKNRFYSHKHESKSIDRPLYRAFKKYGFDNFYIELLEDKKLTGMVSDEGKGYTAANLNKLFDTWYSEKLKTSIYPQYKDTAALVDKVRTEEPKGSAIDKLNSLIGLAECHSHIKPNHPRQERADQRFRRQFRPIVTEEDVRPGCVLDDKMNLRPIRFCSDELPLKPITFCCEVAAYLVKIVLPLNRDITLKANISKLARVVSGIQLPFDCRHVLPL